MLPALATILFAAGGSPGLLGDLGPVDVALAVVVLTGVFVGYRTGFVWQLVVIGSLAACTWVTFAYYPVVADFASEWMRGPVGAVGSVAVTLLAGLLVCGLAAYMVRSAITALKLEKPDRMLGAGLGAMTALILSAMLSFAVVEVSGDHSAAALCVEKSRAATAMGACARRIVPEGVRRQLRRAGSRA